MCREAGLQPEDGRDRTGWGLKSVQMQGLLGRAKSPAGGLSPFTELWMLSSWNAVFASCSVSLITLLSLLFLSLYFHICEEFAASYRVFRGSVPNCLDFWHWFPNLGVFPKPPLNEIFNFKIKILNKNKNPSRLLTVIWLLLRTHSVGGHLWCSRIWFITGRGCWVAAGTGRSQRDSAGPWACGSLSSPPGSSWIALPKSVCDLGSGCRQTRTLAQESVFPVFAVASSHTCDELLIHCPRG